MSLKNNHRKKTNIEKKKYNLDSGVVVQVTGKTFAPIENQLEKTKTSDVNVFITGWSVRANDIVIGTLCKEFSDYTGTETLAIDSRAEDIQKYDKRINILYEEALAISKFIEGRGLKNVIIIGHSRGGDKAINVVNILQNNTNIEIKGLVLFDSVGMYNQTSRELIKGFAKDLVLNTPVTLFKKGLIKKEARAGIFFVTQFFGHIFSEVVRSNFSYPKRFMREMYEMSEQNPHIKNIQVPVIVVSGRYDPISNPEKLVPPNEKRVSENDFLFDYKAGGVLEKRRIFLKEFFFKKSLGVYLFAPKKLGHHGLLFLRPRSVVRASMHALRSLQSSAAL